MEKKNHNKIAKNISLGIAATGLVGNAILARKLPALGKDQGFLKNYAENIKFMSTLPYRALKEKKSIFKILRKRIVGVEKYYKMSLGPKKLHEEMHKRAVDSINKTTTGKYFNITDEKLKELKNYINRPGIKDRNARVVYPHETGVIGYNPSLEKIKQNIANNFKVPALKYMLESQEKEAISKGYKSIIGTSHFDPAQNALAGYEEVKGVDLINSITKNIGYKSAIKKFKKDYYLNGTKNLDHNRVYLLNVNPNELKLVKKDLTNPNSAGFGQTREILKARLNKMKEIKNNPTPAQKISLEEEKKFSTNYNKGLTRMFHGQHDEQYLKEKKAFDKTRRRNKFLRVATVGAAGTLLGTNTLKIKPKKHEG